MSFARTMMLSSVAVIGLVAVSEAAGTPQIKGTYRGSYSQTDGERGSATLTISSQSGNRFSGKYITSVDRVNISVSGTVSAAGKINATGRFGAYRETITARYGGGEISGSFKIHKGSAVRWRGSFSLRR